MRVVTACRAAVVRRFGVGLTLPWGDVWLLPESANDEGVVRHEQAHLNQIARDGAVMWTCKYLWWTLRYGYWANPYEVDARAQDGRDWSAVERN